MLRQLLVSIAVSICNIAIHAIVMAAVLWVARIASERAMSHRSFRLIAIMTATVSVRHHPLVGCPLCAEAAVPSKSVFADAPWKGEGQFGGRGGLGGEVGGRWG
jgi:hypothetical protein